MILEQEMLDFFGQENLIHAIPERLSKINLPQKTREFILNIGFPYVVDYFRFSMDFEAISEDIEIGESAKKLAQLFTIGCKSINPIIGRILHLSEIGLERNANLSEIGKRVRVLGIDEYYLFNLEVTDSCRICIDVDNKGKIVSIAPKDLSISFLNSSIQQLAASLVAYARYCFLEKDFEERIQFFQEELRRIDPMALNSEENVWSNIIERLIENYSYDY